MPFIALSSSRVYYTYNRRPAEGPALVLVHGAGGTHFSWPTTLRLAPFAAAYTLDLPGHGRSPAPGRSTIDAYADVVSEFVTTLNLPQVVVGGISMGGAVAQTLGLRQPDWLTGLLLVGTAAALPVGDAILHHILPEFAAAMRLVARLEWPKGTPDTQIELSYQELISTTPEVVYADFAACHAFDVRSRLHQIAVPTLVIAGTVDKLTPLPQMEYLAQNIPQATLCPFTGAGHMVALEHPEPVAAAVAAWFTHTWG